MIERIRGWTSTRVVKTFSEKSGLIPGWVYTQVELLTMLKIFSISRKKNITEVVFDTVPKFCWNIISRFVLLLIALE